MSIQYVEAIRDIIATFPQLEAHTVSTQIDPQDIYFPKAHVAVLDSSRSLIIGNRGMGKSFWANALVQSSKRNMVAIDFPEAKFDQGDTRVFFGFSGSEGAEGISRDELSLYISNGYPSEMIWRAVTLLHILKFRSDYAGSVKDLLELSSSDPAKSRELLREADSFLDAHDGNIIFVFDQLEHLSDDLESRRRLTQGILRLALAYKSYRRLRVKIFMRPDQRADEKLFSFPDASKISGEAVFLDWRPHDLYGLLFSRLHRFNKNAFDELVRHSRAIDCTGCAVDERTKLPFPLVNDPDVQWKVFDCIAGEYMGATSKRGRPYTWLVLHLADSNNQVSPRTFLTALRTAANHNPPPVDNAIDHYGLNEGVRVASSNRVDDLKEDYPWVPPTLNALNRLLVPCYPDDIFTRWKERDICTALKANTPQEKSPAWLIDANSNDDEFFQSLLSAMANIGVVEERRTTGKVDVPDIFRLPADIRRKGGVTPQQRRLVRLNKS